MVILSPAFSRQGETHDETWQKKHCDCCIGDLLIHSVLLFDLKDRKDKQDVQDFQDMQDDSMKLF